MCQPTKAGVAVRNNNNGDSAMSADLKNSKAPIDVLHPPPSFVARYSCALTMVAIFAAWGKVVYYEDESNAPTIGQELHGPTIPAVMTVIYLCGLPLLRQFAKRFLSDAVDAKALLKETMIVYNAGQVLLNIWMVYRIIDALLFRGHPFIGDIGNVTSGATYAVYIHYMDKYLEFFDTVFMVLRGRMDQVRLILLSLQSKLQFFCCFCLLFHQLCFKFAPCPYPFLVLSSLRFLSFTFITMFLSLGHGGMRCHLGQVVMVISEHC